MPSTRETLTHLVPRDPPGADEVYMSVATVKAYVSRLLTKLEVENRVQIALLVREAEH
jgi:ATP/maltotriose-dependent transcriptional regulator MalT